MPAAASEICGSDNSTILTLHSVTCETVLLELLRDMEWKIAPLFIGHLKMITHIIIFIIFVATAVARRHAVCVCVCVCVSVEPLISRIDCTPY